MSFRHSKIVCTIGPATRSPRMIDRLLSAGMDVARLNFSHGSHEEHAKNISMLRATAIEHEKPIAILADLQGPKIRTGRRAGAVAHWTTLHNYDRKSAGRFDAREYSVHAAAARSPPRRPHPAFRWLDRIARGKSQRPR